MTQVEIERRSAYGPDGQIINTVQAVGDVPTETNALFVNWTTSGVTYYRTQLPAAELKASMFVRDGHGVPRAQVGPQDCPVVVYSMPREEPMYDEIAQMLSAGQKVIVDVDDFLRAFIGKSDHKRAHKYTEEYVSAHEECLSIVDHAICSTPFIAAKVEELGTPTTVIPNALDLKRWDGLMLANTPSATKGMNRDQRRQLAKDPGMKAAAGGTKNARNAIKNMHLQDQYVIIGFSGSTGHADAFKSIAPVIARILREHDDVRFTSAGENMCELIDRDVRHKCIAVPYVPLHDHPKVLTQFAISVGPTLDNDFYSAKSDLRCIEAWASQSAFVGGHTTYGGTIKHREDGYCCETPDDYYSALTLLVTDEKLRMRIAQAGRQRILAERTIETIAPQWRAVIDRVAAE